ncbi:uncharacterized protein MELLADRAFT_108707 [Melampsora larici-populina 98AG31]|uniref:Secreted protein n=1 Tax=Melampsora larici-populina (strain 98AG31 / pathotype 3-4-7) TaxID=747676 RepID=F4RTZ4_MELLP|nr:uncharacterized protein MELLADRAFT_108707 [Melampsora larici-populina 98AG31]EGG04174.1 hypothetical protein MELLADRAFT_108707 [Melampsora larici-populina 98AG31]
MHTSFLFNTLWPILVIQAGFHPTRAHQQLKRGMNPASGSSGQTTSVSHSSFSSNWRALIKEYIAVDLTSLPGLETYAEELKSNWASTSSFTGQTSMETTIKSTKLSGSCDSHGYMVVTATSLVTLSTLYTHLQILQTKCQEKGYTKTVSTIQSTKTQISKVMYTVVKLTSTSDINTCAVAPSKSPYCAPVQSNMDGLRSKFASIELSITQERVDISSKIEINSGTLYQDRPRTIGDVIELCREGHQVAQLGCQGVTTSIPAQGPSGIHFPFNSSSMKTSLKKFIPKGCQAIKSWVSNTTLSYQNGTIPSAQGSTANSTNATIPMPLPNIDAMSNGSPLPPKDQTSSACSQRYAYTDLMVPQQIDFVDVLLPMAIKNLLR